MPASMSVINRRNISEVVSEFGTRLFGFIRRRVDSDEDAEDILQDVWYQLTSMVDTEPVSQAGAWLYRVARNRITDIYRKKKPVAFDPSAIFGGDDGLSFREILLADNTDPEFELLRTIFWEQLEAALNELPEAQRQVFVWHELEDLSFKEIAERTGENMNTLLSRKRYAMLHLRERLGSVYAELINR